MGGKKVVKIPRALFRMLKNLGRIANSKTSPPTKEKQPKLPQIDSSLPVMSNTFKEPISSQQSQPDLTEPPRISYSKTANVFPMFAFGKCFGHPAGLDSPSFHFYSTSELSSLPSSEPITDNSVACKGSLNEHGLASESSLCNCKASSKTTDLATVMGDKSVPRATLEVTTLPPIATKPKVNNMDKDHANAPLHVKIAKEASVKMVKEVNTRTSSRSPRLKLRSNSPRIGSAKVRPRGKSFRQRKKSSSSSETVAVVKCSSDPQRDFWESMVEMIVESNINDPKDLEELLICYLSLNSNKYHDLIVKVFRQIWLDLNQIGV
ncbi:Ovate protein family, C-terminal [Dillenia turbinata]|uniref:Transcription repressor n=1 Tax=Dillenia turbinata TaxID=194707 RepID=A0AAN8VG69_9MAGN